MLAIDGGNSKTDVALVAGDGTLLASARGPGINAHEVGVDQTVLILDAVVKQAAAQLDYRPSGPLARRQGCRVDQSVLISARYQWGPNRQDRCHCGDRTAVA